MDNDTRYWITKDMADTKFQHNADRLLELTKKNIGGKIPRHFITDGFPAYQKASRRVFGKKTQHDRHIHLKHQMNNNIHDRFNCTLRRREQVFRGLKKKDSPIIDGLRIYYNFTKKHSSFNDLTPTEASGININEKNKWKVLIQNSTLEKMKRC